MPANDPGRPGIRANQPVEAARRGDGPTRRSADFNGVAISKQADQFAILLVHRDPAATVSLGCYRRLSEALNLRDALARLWALPELAIDANGAVEGRARRLGRITVGAPADRRNGGLGRTRPRFLTRRKPGSPTDQRPLAGRELIAPD